MQHKCLVTVLDKKCFSDYQEQYLADPQSGPCPFYQVGDQFLFTRYGEEDTFWYAGKGSQCAEAWDCISRYIYTALQGGSIMRNWTRDERMMIACCNDGTRPVIFQIQRLDYQVVKLQHVDWDTQSAPLQAALEALPGVDHVIVRPDQGFLEVFLTEKAPLADDLLRETVARVSGSTVTAID